MIKDEPLFKDVKDRQITAYDLFGKKCKRHLKNFKFRPSAYGILQIDNQLLVQRHPLLNKFGFPGGGIEIGESISEGLEREFEEETGLKVKAGKLLGITEDYFTFKGVDIHGILMFYEVQKVGGKIFPNGNGQDTGEVKFMDIDEFSKDNSSRSQWKFIKNYIQNRK